MKISIDQPPSPEPPPFPSLPALVESDDYIVLAQREPVGGVFKGTLFVDKHNLIPQENLYRPDVFAAFRFRPFRGTITLSNDE